jgi:hypothetical protein
MVTAMLECEALLISGPFEGRLTGLKRDTIRQVKDLAAGTVLGRVRYRAKPLLAAWRATELLRVEEGADLSDLCQVRQLPWWEAAAIVVDAEGHAVARWRDPLLESPRDGWRATVKANGTSGRAWLGGAAIAEWGAEEGGIGLRFLGNTEGRPFVRMAVLAVVLMRT